MPQTKVLHHYMLGKKIPSLEVWKKKFLLKPNHPYPLPPQKLNPCNSSTTLWKDHFVTQTFLNLVDKIPCGCCLCKTSLAKLCKVLFFFLRIYKKKVKFSCELVLWLPLEVKWFTQMNQALDDSRV